MGGWDAPDGDANGIDDGEYLSQTAMFTGGLPASSYQYSLPPGSERTSGMQKTAESNPFLRGISTFTPSTDGIQRF